MLVQGATHITNHIYSNSNQEMGSAAAHPFLGKTSGGEQAVWFSAASLGYKEIVTKFVAILNELFW